MASIRTGGLFPEKAGSGWTVQSFAHLVWSSPARVFTVVTDSGAHNLGIIWPGKFLEVGTSM